MDWIDFGRAVFHDPESPAFFSADFAREFVVAVFIFLIGWAASLRSARGRMKARLIDELVLSQRELFKRAYPPNWNENDVRERIMLQPFADKVEFIIFNLKSENQMGASEIADLENYHQSVLEFIDVWARVRRRSRKYDAAYEATFASLNNFLDRFAPRHVRRISGLIDRAANGAETDQSGELFGLAD